MSGAAPFVEQFCQRLLDDSTSCGISDFQLFYSEEKHLGDETGLKESGRGRLILYWRDGSHSVHLLRHPFPFWTELPLDEWRSVRCPDRPPVPGMAHDASAYPQISMLDPQVAAWVTKYKRPSAPTPFSLRLAHVRQWAANSRGLFLQTEGTEVKMQHVRHGMLISYSSRRYPTAGELEYLQAETEWYDACAPVQVPQVSLRQNGYMLFSPDAFRTLIDHGLGAHLGSTQGRSLLKAGRDLFRTSMTISISLDPLRPWSLGSRRFTESGSPALPVKLTGTQAAPLETIANHYHRSSLHWQSDKEVAFHRFLAAAEHVYLVSQLYLPERFSPFAPVTAWSLKAVRFHCGRPVQQGALAFPCCLGTLLSSNRLQLVKRVGWDGTGVAVPIGEMGDDS
ncbi:MAG: hypothetical protein H0Z34_00675 [Brevibacillus sp.]|nr:hypothetical protein [Brevibacillus sp.]